MRLKSIWLAMFICMSAGVVHAQTRSFDRKTWETSLPELDSSRLQLFQRFVRNQGVIGKSRSEIISMLGPGELESGKSEFEVLRYLLNRRDSSVLTQVVSIRFNSAHKADAWTICPLAHLYLPHKWHYIDKDEVLVEAGYVTPDDTTSTIGSHCGSNQLIKVQKLNYSPDR